MIRITESSGSNKNTHTHIGYQKAFRECREFFLHKKDHTVLDLFARECPWGDYRNDINPKFLKQNTNMCMDALEAAKEFKNSTIDIILFDPPFSNRMDADKYKEVGRASLWTDPKYISDIGKEMYRILNPFGLIIKAGFNSNPPDPRLVFVKGYVSHYGGSRNDVIFTIWQRMDTSLSC